MAPLTDPCRGSSASSPITPPPADKQTNFHLFFTSICSSVFCTKFKQNALCCNGPMPDPENKATNIKLHPSLSTLLPSHAHPPPSRPEAKAPRHAQKRVGTDPTHPHSPASFYPSSPPPLSFNNNLGFEFSETHTARKCNCTARTASPLFSNSLLPPEWLDLFSLHHFFLLLLLEFCSPPPTPNHHHHIFNGFQAITVSPKVEKENSRRDAAPVEKFNKMWKPSTLFQPPFRESVCDRKRAHAHVQKHPRYSPQSWVKNFLFLTHMHTHTNPSGG